MPRGDHEVSELGDLVLQRGATLRGGASGLHHLRHSRSRSPQRGGPPDPVLGAALGELGFSSLEDFLVGFWEGFFLDDRDADNLLTMLWTWQHGDVGATPGFDGDLDRALASITARAIVMPAEKDLHLPPEDEEYEVPRMPDAELRVIPGVWGHFAGGGAHPQDTAFIDRALAELLAE